MNDTGNALPSFVGGGADVKRVIELPHWQQGEVPDYTLRLRRPGGTFTLRPEQNAALWQLERWGGLIAEITMGGGKGLVCMAAPYLLRLFGHKVERPLLVVPANLEGTYWRERAKFEKHFWLCGKLRVVSYETLSIRQKYLDEYQPDLILFDEADKLRNPKSARGRRLFTYLHEHSECRVAFLSGTFTRRSIKEYAHLVGYALRQYSFVPQRKSDIASWSEVMDDAAIPDAMQLSQFRSILPVGYQQSTDAENKRSVQRWYRGRRSTAPGSVVSHGEDGVGASLLFEEITVQTPAVVKDAIMSLEATWTKPDGDEQESALAVWNTTRQLSVGMYYLWDWPIDPRTGAYIKDKEWLEKRSRWHRAIRKTLELERKGLDSPMQIARFVDRPGGAEELPDVAYALTDWRTVSHRDPPPTKVVWLHPFLLDAAIEWILARMKEGSNGIVWFRHRAVGVALRARGLPVFMDSGQDFDMSEKFCAASIAQHGRGKNLQETHSNNLLLEIPGTHDEAEQLFARTHRPGQQESEVVVAYFAHTEPIKYLLSSLWSQAIYVEATTGKATKTRRGTWVNPSWPMKEE